MIAFPEARRRAQAEIDAVVGHDRLPTFADTPRLPYVRAITRDILRWCPTIPSSYLTSRPIKTGAMARIFRKKGATCISDVWHRNHDQAVFGDDADEFRPGDTLMNMENFYLGRLEQTRQGVSRSARDDGSA